MPRYKIADVVFDAKIRYRYTERICKEYEYQGEEQPCFSTIITDQDIANEKALAPDFPEPYLEGLALFRKLCDYTLTEKNGIIFHSSAIAVDGKAYLFTAPSGTGKSTHTRLWRETLGDKAVMVNDDKPIIRYVDDKFYVYGTPWTGKHNLGSNIRAEVKAICKIAQSKENAIRRATTQEMLMTVLNQTVRPSEPEKMDKLLSLIDKMLKEVELYSLECNVSEEAAKLSYNYMSKGE